MKISKKELQEMIVEEIQNSVEEGLFDKLKKGFDFFTKGPDLKAISPDKQATDVSDKQVDITTGLEKEKGEANSAMRKAKDELMDVVKFAAKSQREMQAKITDFVSEMNPKNESDVEFMKGAEAFTRTLEDVAKEYETFFGAFSRLVKQMDAESDHADFKADPTATMKMIGKSRAGRGAPDDSKRGKMFAKESKELRKTVKEEVYKALLNKVKK